MCTTESKKAHKDRMLRNVFFYMTEKISVSSLASGLEAYQIRTKQIVLSDHREPEIPAHLEETICITDSGRLCRLFLSRQLPVIAYLSKGSGGQEFGEVKYAVETPEAIDYAYLKGVYQRYRGIPWTILETERCLIREVTVEDIEMLYELYQEPSITAYMENLYPSVEEEKAYTQKYIENIYPFYEYGMWLVIEKASGRIIGRAGVEQSEREEEGLELGYMIGKPYQRKRYAYEVCTAIMEYAFSHLAVSNIYSTIEKENIPSIQLIQKLGFSHIGEKQEGGKEYLQYRYRTKNEK